MTRPYERWHHLWGFFMTLDAQAPYDTDDEEERMADELSGAPTAAVVAALAQWHEAFDNADDEELERVAVDFTPSYDPTQKFGGYRQWAEWVREHLERELAARSDKR